MTRGRHYNTPNLQIRTVPVYHYCFTVPFIPSLHTNLDITSEFDSPCLSHHDACNNHFDSSPSTRLATPLSHVCRRPNICLHRSTSDFPIITSEPPLKQDSSVPPLQSCLSATPTLGPRTPTRTRRRTSKTPRSRRRSRV